MAAKSILGARVVYRVHSDHKTDVQILVPNKEPKWVDGVREGKGDHEFTLLD